MKERVNYRVSESLLSKTDMIETVFKHLLMGFLGFAAAKAPVREIMLPFGLSFVAGATGYYSPSVAAGVFFGYLFPTVSGNGFRYLAALFAVIAIKFMVAPYKKISENPIFSGGITLLSSGITNVLTLSGTPSDTAAFLCESFLAGAGAYFVSKSIKVLESDFTLLSAEDMASLLITIDIFIIGLERISFYGVSLGKISGILLLLIVSKYGGIVSGAVGGIVLSFSASLSGSYNTPYFAYSLGGLVSGIFAPLGRYAQAAAILGAYIVDQSISGFNDSFVKGFAEVIIGSIAFFFMPKSFGTYFGRLFALGPKIVENSGMKKSMHLRLNMASAALLQISQTTENVSKQLSKINTPNFGEVINNIEKKTCKGCKDKSLCWERKRNITIDAILMMTKSLKGIDEEYTPTVHDLKGRCVRFDKLNTIAIKEYTEYSKCLAAENRIEEVRSVVCNQFAGISDMLLQLANEFDRDDCFNSSMATNIASALKGIDIYTEEAEAKTDKYGRTTVTLKIKRTPDLIINKRQIMKIASIAGELVFDVPTVTRVGDYEYISLFEQTKFKADVGTFSISATENSVCGDAVNCFNDGKGHSIMILSDGMGTGGRAAVDGAMASGLMAQLIKAGFGYDCSINLLNSSMLFKSSDESSATLDIASIDLFNAQLQLYKAGAAPTIIRRNGSCGKAQSASLPIGILENIGFDTAKIRLKSGDIVVLCSDGATADGTDWIMAEVEAFRDGTAQQLAKNICKIAKKRQYEGKPDDITVAVAIINKAS